MHDQQANPENYIKGIVRQEIFYKEEDGYGVYVIQVQEASVDEGLDEVTVTGHFLRLQKDEIYIFYGEWVGSSQVWDSVSGGAVAKGTSRYKRGHYQIFVQRSLSWRR